jgi:hypothetical protein
MMGQLRAFDGDYDRALCQGKAGKPRGYIYIYK